MDNINKDNLIKFISYSIIVFLLSVILYLMYIDFLTETFNTSLNINYTTNDIYILKRDILINNQSAIVPATCTIDDIILDNTNECKINQHNFYAHNYSINNFTIQVLPDYMSAIPDVSNFTKYTYPNQKDRESLFYFLDKNNERAFDITNKYELCIIKYFNNYYKYNTNKLRKKYNTPSLNSPTPSYRDDDVITIFKDLLLLENSNSSDIFTYKSKYNDINDIKNNIIDIYNNIINPTNIKYNMIIEDTTNLTFYYDSPDSLNIYTFELNPHLKITFTNLLINYVNLPSNISKESIWSLYYVSELIPMELKDSINIVYSDNIKYPIVLPLATPNTNEWENNTINGVIDYFDTIFKNPNTKNIKILNINDEQIKNNMDRDAKTIVIDNLSNFINYIGVSKIISITDICVLYDTNTGLFESWVLTNLPNNIFAPLIIFSTIYDPNLCIDNKVYYDKMCMPSCPSDYKYDLGIVCLKDDPKIYLPNSPQCKKIDRFNRNLRNIPDVIQGIIKGCNPNNIKDYDDEQSARLSLSGVKKSNSLSL